MNELKTNQGVPVVKRRHARPLELDSDEEEEEEEEEKKEELGSEQDENDETKISNSDQVKYT